ncbi:MAG: 50S ribosomal protein L18 [Candidatus Sungbacteria bacterium]|nr:50S ribosomal protein L18 [Candidatus Sungbacteria bacterium]
MPSNKEKKLMRSRRVRARIKGTELSPRLSVFRSRRHISVQLINDLKGETIASASDCEVGQGKGAPSSASVEKARQVGELIAERAKAQKILRVKFDRGQYRFHGLVKALAEGARKSGLEF